MQPELEKLRSLKIETCPACGEDRPAHEMHAGQSLPNVVADKLKAKYPKWSKEKRVCENCMNQSRVAFLAERLSKHRERLSDEDREVLSSFLNEVLLPEDENLLYDEEMTFSEKVSGTIAMIVASWYFPLGIALFLVGWTAFNFIFLTLDPFPMVWLGGISAVLATLSALHGPFIMMSQRATFRRDRMRAQNDYKVNLRAELQIEYLSRQIQHLMDRQEELLNERES